MVHVQIAGTSCVLRVMFFPKGFVGHDLALDSFQIFRDLEKFPTLNTQLDGDFVPSDLAWGDVLICQVQLIFLLLKPKK